MWESITNWLVMLRPLLTNAFLGYWVYRFAASHHYAQIAGILAFILFGELDLIKKKLELQSDRLYSFNRTAQSYRDLFLRMFQRR